MFILPRLGFNVLIIFLISTGCIEKPEDKGSPAESQERKSLAKVNSDGTPNLSPGEPNNLEGIDFITTYNYANSRLEFYYYIPDGVLKNKSLGTDALVAVPGLSGRGEVFVNSAMKKFAADENVVIIAPSFVYDKDNWNSNTSYQYPEAWSGDALVEIINKVNLTHGLGVSRLYMYGFSAGAQYSLRFALWRPFMALACAAHGGGGTVIPDYPVSTKFLVSVGNSDTSRIPKAEAFIQAAQRLGIDVTYRQYAGGHGIPREHVRDSLQFFSDIKNSRRQ